MTAAAGEGGGLFRAAWRWHFYAGLIVLPVLLWLAATGALYLYKAEIERVFYGSWSRIEQPLPPRPLAELIPAIGRQAGGTVTQVMRPADADASWRMSVTMADGTRRLAFVDPGRATLLGTAPGKGLMETVKDLHSLAITGPVGNALVEIVAGWAIVLVVTGLILWWPRGGSPAMGLRGRASGRLFWRDLHASVGVVAAAVVLFLASTGMPWTVFAGRQLNDWVKSSGNGRPAKPSGRVGETASDEHAAHDHGGGASILPWSMQRMAAPASHPSRPGQEATPDLALDRATWVSLKAPWTLTLPRSPGAPYLFSTSTVRAEEAHVVYVDAATGRVLQDARYPQFGAGARWIEWGIATHQGQQYGEPNRLVMLFGCISIWVLGLTGPLLWWKRRRDGRLAEPPRGDRRRERVLAGSMLVLALALPLTGLTMIAALAGEAMWRRIRRQA